MKRLFLIAALTAGFFAMVSCEDEEYSTPPKYDSVICLNSNPKVGDTLTLQVKASSLGDKYYRARCRWTINGGTFLPPPIPQVYYRDFSVDKKTAYVIIVDPMSNLPSIRWVPSSAGTFEVEFGMTLSMSMPTVKGYMTYEMGGYTVVPGVVDPAVKGTVTVKPEE